VEGVTQIPDDLHQVIDLLQKLLRVLSPLLDPKQIAVLLLKDSFDFVWGIWTGFVLTTTDVDHGGAFVQSAAIRQFEPTVQLVANSLLVLAVLWASYRIMWAHGVRTQYTARVLLPRLFMGGVLINFSQPMFQAVVEASNTLSVVVMRFQNIADLQVYWHTLTVNPQDSVLQVATTLILVLGYDVLAVAYVVRYTILIVLAISAPLAALMFVLPDTLHLAKLWRKIFVTNLFMQPIQLFVIAIGFGLENTSISPLRHAFALAALLIVFKVPGALGTTEQVAHKLEALLTHSATEIQHAVVKAL